MKRKPSGPLAIINLAVLSVFVAMALVPGASAQSICDGTTPIYAIQGATHISPYRGATVETCGIVTAVGFNSYYIQDPVGDGDDETSDGMFVFDSR